MNTKALKTLTVAVSLVTGMGVSGASFADTRAGGEGTTANVTLDIIVDEVTDVWDILESESLTLTSASQCIVTACSDVANSSAATLDNDYNFVISFNDTSPGLNTVSERSIELSDNAGVDDPNVWPVCSTRHETLAAGDHTIYWLGARANAADRITTVNDTSMTVGCFPGSEL